MATLLLELFSEEIPSRMQRGAAEQLQRLIGTGLEKNLLQHAGVKTFVSPRHLAIEVNGLPTVQPDVKEEKRGPKIGAPEQAMKGFLQSTGLKLEQCEQRDGYYYASIERKGQPVAEVVKKICEEALSAFSWPKSMHWGSRDTRPLAWVRPLHRITCLLDDKIVPVTFAHLTASNITEGHRFLSKGEIKITHAEKYEETLKAAHVIVDYAARRALIAEKIAATAAAAKLQVVEDEALLDEVTGLVEWPVPLLGSFDAAFLDLPPEVLISEMKVHQRYFALQGADGKLASQFIAVANMVTNDGGKQVIAGNSRVLRARLSDGEFYWNQDQKTPLADWAKKLSDVVFHAKVGMMNEKVERIEKLAVAIAKEVGFTDTPLVQQAARLCKADLTSGMVGEFPELQGIMGRYYASAQGEPAAIADAIRDHYKPLGASDSVPDEVLAAIIAVADKLDSIISLFAADEKPTGSKDPLALRRAALGILRIVLKHQWQLDLQKVIAVVVRETVASVLKLAHEEIQKKYTKDLLEDPDFAKRAKKAIDKITAESTEEGIGMTINEIIDFFQDRLKQLLRDETIAPHIIEAGLKSGDKTFVPALLVVQTKSLAGWVASDSGKASVAAIKRAQNILAAEEKKSKSTFAYDTKKLSALVEPSEKTLQQLLQQLNAKTPADLNPLAAPINAFFADVMVNAEEPKLREARLALLAGVRETASTIADFSKIEG